MNQKLVKIPGLFDMHVHFRQPGQTHKENIETGSRAAYAGGVTTVQVMPNTNPVLDTPELIQNQINQNFINLIPSAAITKNLEGRELTDFRALKLAGVKALTDDGKPVMNADLMKEAFILAEEHDLLIMQHAEDLSLSKGASLSLGRASKELKFEGQDPNSEGAMVERDIDLVREIGARYHVLHISTKRALDAVRKAKLENLPITCEVTPHHYLLTEDLCLSQNTNYKMNPPLRSEQDRKAILEALIDGTIDAVASDHAPHSAEEKSCHFCDAPFGVVGLETAFASLLTLVYKKIINLDRAVYLMTEGPRKILNLSKQEYNNQNSYCLIDLNHKWRVNLEDLKGKSKNSAFLNYEFTGRVLETYVNKKLVYKL